MSCITKLINYFIEIASWAFSGISSLFFGTAKKTHHVATQTVKSQPLHPTNAKLFGRASKIQFPNNQSTTKIASRTFAQSNGLDKKPAPRPVPQLASGGTKPQKKTIIMPSLGNCLFDSFVFCYMRLKNRVKDITSVESLRHEVVEYMRKNYRKDSILKINIDEAVKERIEILMTKLQAFPKKQAELQKQYADMFHLSDDNLVKQYFTDMTRMGVWGSQAELYALSKIFKVTIHVEQKGFTKPVSFNEGQSRSVTLKRVNNNHYNACIIL